MICRQYLQPYNFNQNRLDMIQQVFMNFTGKTDLPGAEFEVGGRVAYFR